MAVELRICKCCELPKPYDAAAKKDRKASGFHACICWDCYLAAHRERNHLVVTLETGEIISTGAFKSRKIRRKRHIAATAKYCGQSPWHILRYRLGLETRQLMRALVKGTTYGNMRWVRLFGHPRNEVHAHVVGQLEKKGLRLEDYQVTWQLDHVEPVALAENDVELRAMFKLDNCQVLTLEEHALKTLEDNDLVRRSSMTC